MISYFDGYKYQLAVRYKLQLPEIFIPEQEVLHDYFAISKNGMLIIRKGYCWDGPSGPTIDTANFMRGSLIHDVLYQAMRLGLISRKLRDDADKLLVEICREDGMSKLRRWWVYKGVKWGGEQCTLPSHRKTIKFAP